MTKTICTNAAELVCALRAAALAAPSASCLAEWGKWEESAKKTNTAHGLASADAKPVANASAEELEAQAYAADLERLAAEFPQLQRAKSRYTGGKLVAANIRILLKAAFKGTKFSVKSDYDSVRVGWMDGPTDAQVNAVIGRFYIGAADHNTDYFYTISTAFSDLFGGVQYLFTNRELGEATISASLAALYGDNGPSFADWKAGKPWAQVAHGNMGHDRYSGDPRGWLSHVRRHANGK